MRSLAIKLVLAFLTISLVGTAVMALFAGQVTASEFGHYTARQNQAAVAAELATFYRLHGGWEGVETAVSFRGVGGGRRQGPGAGGGMALADADGRLIIGGLGFRPGEQLATASLASGMPVVVDGRQVGLLLVGGGGGDNWGQAEAAFLAQVNRALVWAAGGATAVALLLAILLARTFTRPLRELTAATRAVAQGDLAQQVTVRSQDELGELAVSFNQMSADLARSRDMRRQMTADIAHDLRTPISIILGHAEALEDGVLPLTAENLHIIHDEAQRLNRLVVDLRTLSLTEAGELPLARRPTDLAALLERAVLAHTPQAQQQQVALQVDVPSDLPQVEIDPDRMAQVLGNLLSNALRHTLPHGRIQLSADRTDDGLCFSVRDTGTGIPPEALPHVFDRFYRGDKSRRRDGQGGSGLGLAIARSIVVGHRGRVWAESEPGQGTAFFVWLPFS